MQNFAEAKNAALMGSCLVAGTIASTVLLNASTPPELKLYAGSAVLFFMLAMAFAATSFLPKPKQRVLRASDDSNNYGVLYFGDIKHHDIASYKRKLDTYFQGADAPALEAEMIEQIIVNAKITAEKMMLFKVGMYLFLSAVFTPLGGVLAAAFGEVRINRFMRGS